MGRGIGCASCSISQTICYMNVRAFLVLFIASTEVNPLTAQQGDEDPPPARSWRAARLYAQQQQRQQQLEEIHGHHGQQQQQQRHLEGPQGQHGSRVPKDLHEVSTGPVPVSAMQEVTTYPEEHSGSAPALGSPVQSAPPVMSGPDRRCVGDDSGSLRCRSGIPSGSGDAACPAAAAAGATAAGETAPDAEPSTAAAGAVPEAEVSTAAGAVAPVGGDSRHQPPRHEAEISTAAAAVSGHPARHGLRDASSPREVQHPWWGRALPIVSHAASFLLGALATWGWSIFRAVPVRGVQRVPEQEDSGVRPGHEQKDSGVRQEQVQECAQLPTGLGQTASEVATEVFLTSGRVGRRGQEDSGQAPLEAAAVSLTSSSAGRRGQEDAAQRTETWLCSTTAVVAAEMTEPGRQAEGAAMPGEETVSDEAFHRGEGEAAPPEPLQPAGQQELLGPEGGRRPPPGCEFTSPQRAVICSGVAHPSAAKYLSVTKQSSVLHRRLSVAPLSAANRRRQGGSSSGRGGGKVHARTVTSESDGGLGAGRAARRSRPAINLSMNLQVGGRAIREGSAPVGSCLGNWNACHHVHATCVTVLFSFVPSYFPIRLTAPR